jgi:hypothetical protein
MSAIFSTLNTNLQNIESPKVYNNILLAHLVFKCLVKIAVWLWNKIDKLPRGEVEKNALWVYFILVNLFAALLRGQSVTGPLPELSPSVAITRRSASYHCVNLRTERTIGAFGLKHVHWCFNAPHQVVWKVLQTSATTFPCAVC